ncbi:hypothetical protein B0H19DRAFT_1259029 [Mycena capillaripes]|nr:hypothetical protein B0H19DRAFT_1259029 [Mycena capillaripes]
MFSRFFLVPLFFSVALLSSAAFTPFNKNLAIRQIQTDPACANECAAFSNDITECNNTVVKGAATCLTCNVQHGSIPQDQAQQTLNTFVQECDDNGQPVNNITISATSGSVPSGGSGSTHTSEPTEEPTSTGAEDPSPTDDPSQTDAAGDSASASANATNSASASGASAGASSAERMRCRSATVITAVMVVLSVVVGST